MTLQDKVRIYNQKRRELDERVLAGLEQPPICFTCKTLSKAQGMEAQPATYITTGVTLAGYRAYKCDEHVPKRPRRLREGWQVEYMRIDGRTANSDT